MVQSFTSSQQGVIAVSVGNQSVGTEVILKDKKGNTILSHEPELPFAFVILSNPDMVKGEGYILTVGSVSEELTASE